MGVVIDKIGPKGLEYARFSIDSHFTRNYLFTKRNYPEKLEQHVPEFAKKIVAQYKLPKWMNKGLKAVISSENIDI